MKEPPPIDASATSDSTSSETGSARKLPKRELIYGAIGLILGFVVLPLLIFMVGTVILGPYAGGQSIGAFFAGFYINLGHGALRTWFIALSPYLAIWLVRLSFRRFSFGKSDPAEPPADPRQETLAQAKSPRSRREPFISP